MDSRNNIMRKRIAFLFFNIFIVVLMSFNIMNSKIKPLLETYSNHECENLLSKIISVTIEEQVNDKMKNEIMTYSNDGEIEFNAILLNSIMTNTMKSLQYYLYELENGTLNDELLSKIGIDVNSQKLSKGIVYEIPLYRLTNNLLLSNIGINIPVSFRMVGKMSGEIISNVKEYGINNALIELRMNIFSTVDVISPFISNNYEHTTSIPLFIRAVQGNIPSFYYGEKIVGGEF